MHELTVAFVQQNASHPTGKRPQHIDSFLSAMTYFAVLLSHIPFLQLFSEFLPKGWIKWAGPQPTRRTSVWEKKPDLRQS